MKITAECAHFYETPVLTTSRERERCSDTLQNTVTVANFFFFACFFLVTTSSRRQPEMCILMPSTLRCLSHMKRFSLTCSYLTDLNLEEKLQPSSDVGQKVNKVEMWSVHSTNSQETYCCKINTYHFYGQRNL